jgi:hypothetical protein
LFANSILSVQGLPVSQQFVKVRFLSFEPCPFFQFSAKYYNFPAGLVLGFWF